MKSVLFKTVAIMLSLIMVLALFSACNNTSSNSNDAASIDAIVNAAVKAALDSAASPTVVTIEADGRQFIIEDTEGKTARQILTQAGITLNEGDVLTVIPDQTITGNITIQVLRRCTVTIVVLGKKSKDDVTYTTVLIGGNVADALASVGVELAEDQTVNFEMDQALENGMEIVVSKGDKDSSKNTGSSSSSSGSGSSGSGSSSGGSSGSEEDSDSGNERTIVSIEIYEDCDGSGHGVKVITYSDGTQEEVPF